MTRRISGEGTFRIRENNKFEYRVRFHNEAFGRFERKSFYGESKSECLKKYKAFLRESREKSIGDSPTLYAWIVQYTKTYRTTVKDATLAHYLSIANRYIQNSIIGTLPLHTIKPIQIQHFMNQHSDRSGSHLGKMRDLISSAFECAIDNDLCQKNPCKNIVVSSRIKRASLDNTFTAQECITIRNYCLHSSDRIAFAPLVFLYTGMRQGELLGLQWSDIDFENNCLHIARTACVDSKCKKYISPRPKTDGSIRTVYILPQLKEILLKQPKSSLFVISTKAGDFYNSNSFNKMHKRFVHTIPGVRPLGTHAYRHALITHLGNAGASLDDIAGIVGHDNADLTRKVYFFNDGSRSKKALDMLPY